MYYYNNYYFGKHSGNRSVTKRRVKKTRLAVEIEMSDNVGLHGCSIFMSTGLIFNCRQIDIVLRMK